SENHGGDFGGGCGSAAPAPKIANPWNLRTGSKKRALFIVNKILPDNDYRLFYGRRSAVCEVVYGLPERSPGLADDEYVRLGFEEGLHAGVLRALWDLYRYLRRSRGSLAFVHFFTTNPILFGPIIARLTGVPYVVTVTGFGRVTTSADRKYALLRPVYRFFFRHALRHARLVLFQNRSDLAELTAQHPALSGKFHYAGSTTTAPEVTVKDFDSPVLDVLLGTRLMPDKGVVDFIAVAREMQGSVFRFLLAGKESRGYGNLYQEILQADRDQVIEFLGELDTPEMEAVLARAHILFFPSYGEGLARLMLEAGAARLCPIAYNIPSNRDLIEEGRGFLVETGNLQQVVTTLASLAADRELVERNAAAYQFFILRQYGSSQFTERLDHLFREMLDTPELAR
ncbi:MAG TPA: glycosyltransferase, partial [Anaerolineales bacterium]|nr:glycosyltransferase [Anaerolineales bacterium]